MRMETFCLQTATIETIERLLDESGGDLGRVIRGRNRSPSSVAKKKQEVYSDQLVQSSGGGLLQNEEFADTGSSKTKIRKVKLASKSLKKHKK